MQKIPLYCKLPNFVLIRLIETSVYLDYLNNWDNTKNNTVNKLLTVFSHDNNVCKILALQKK